MANKARRLVRGGVPITRTTDDLQTATRDAVKRELARELHDRVAQTLTVMLVQMEEVKTGPGTEDELREDVDRLQQSTREVLSNIRQLLHDLRGEPGFVDDFVASVRNGLLGNFHKRTGIKVHLRVSRGWSGSLPSPVALNLYRILQESLHNVRLHSGARLVCVRLSASTDGSAELEVEDDGMGFENLADERYRGMGWLGMAERATLLGGRLTVSTKPGLGTRVRASFPRLIASTQNS